MKRKFAAVGAAALMTVGLSLAAAPAYADSIPTGERCGIWTNGGYYKMVFVKNCLSSQGAVVKVDRVAWGDATICVSAGTTDYVGDLEKIGPKSVRGVDYLGPVSHC